MTGERVQVVDVKEFRPTVGTSGLASHIVGQAITVSAFAMCGGSDDIINIIEREVE